MDSLEWPKENSKLTDKERDKAVTELIEMVAAVDGLLQAQAQNDVDYFLAVCQGNYREEEVKRIRALVLKAYRWQYIFSGVDDRRFQQLIGGMINESQGNRIREALGTLM
jgi:hypothetical protein